MDTALPTPTPSTDALALAKIQRVLDHYTHGTCPLTAADFLHVSRATGLACEVMLTQGWMESHLGTDPGRPQETENVCNVGNVDDGTNLHMGSWLAGLTRYAVLVATKYGKTAEQLLASHFERLDGQGRYATDPNYCHLFREVLGTVRALMADVS